VNRVREFEKGLLEHVATNAGEVYREIVEKKELLPEAEKKLRAAIEEYKAKFTA
jgi:F-type H+-transporting ATPase subunit alpha